MNENYKALESKDLAPHARTYEVLMVRHGLQEDYSAQEDTPLSPEGVRQAEEFAQNLIKECAGREVVFKIKHSEVTRAAQTAEAIERTLEAEITKHGLNDLRLLHTKQKSDLKTTGSLGPILKSGVPYEKSVDEWLGNFEKYEGSKSPSEISSQIENFVAHSDRLAKRLPEQGPDIVLIWVTHETAHAALMNKVTGKNTEKLGGRIDHLESIRFSFSHDLVPPTGEFRGEKFNLDSINDQENA